MKKLSKQMKERRLQIGDAQAQKEAEKEIEIIHKHLEKRASFQQKMNDLLAGVRKRENLFQILAKTKDEDENEQDYRLMAE